MIPNTLTGPQFLAFYIGLLTVLLVVAGIVRTSLRGPSDDRFPPTLDSYQAALLAAGYQGAGEAAIVALTARGSLMKRPIARSWSRTGSRAGRAAATRTDAVAPWRGWPTLCSTFSIRW